MRGFGRRVITDRQLISEAVPGTKAFASCKTDRIFSGISFYAGSKSFLYYRIKEKLFVLSDKREAFVISGEREAF